MENQTATKFKQWEDLDIYLFSCDAEQKALSHLAGNDSEGQDWQHQVSYQPTCPPD